jgi:DNA-binding response OmpR family regulator
MLLVEGSRSTRDQLAAGLAADRFRVHAVADAAEGRRALQSMAPEVLVIDLDLPDASGFELLRHVRRGTPEGPWDAGVPVITLSQVRHPHDVVRAIEQGADDHLARPYHYAELLARTRGLLRRTRGETLRDEVRVGALVVDRRSRCATLNGRVVDLSAKEFALLDALARDPRRVLTKQELLRDVWGYIATGRTRTVDSHASRLRRKLETCGAGQRFVANVWGIGYRLLPEGA